MSGIKIPDFNPIPSINNIQIQTSTINAKSKKLKSTWSADWHSTNTNVVKTHSVEDLKNKVSPESPIEIGDLVRHTADDKSIGVAIAISETVRHNYTYADVLWASISLPPLFSNDIAGFDSKLVAIIQKDIDDEIVAILAAQDTVAKS